MTDTDTESLAYDRLLPGSTAFERYLVLEVIGSGATSVVYRCRNIVDRTLLALKVLTSDAAQEPKVVARFRNEIHASYRIRHQNVLRVDQFFREGNYEAFTMELVEGGSLSDLLSDEEPLPYTIVVDILRQLTSGLSAIHGAGVIHRDIKPDNVLLTEQRVAKICDFNTALCWGSSRVDEEGVGTLEYMSPEVLIHGRAEERSDIFSLGVVLYQLITGELPFTVTCRRTHEKQMLKEKYRRPSVYRPDCPRELEKCIEWMLRTSPDARPRSAGELFSKLGRLDLTPRSISFVGRALRW